MGLVPPPRVATLEEYKEDPKYHNDVLKYWDRYHSNPFGWLFWLIDRNYGKLINPEKKTKKD